MVDWATIIASVVFSLVGSVLLVEYRLRREQSLEDSLEVEEWYSDSYGHAADVRRAWHRIFDGSERSGGNLSEIQGEMSLLEGQISRHATTGEQLDADEDVISALDDLAAQCRRPSEQTLHLNSTSEFIEYREDVLDAVDNVEQALETR